MKPLPSISETIQRTPFSDTHEHLIEESRRLAGPKLGDPLVPCDDWSYLILPYSRSDLTVAGMPMMVEEKERNRFFSPNLSSLEKWKMVEPYWPMCKHTGFLQAVRHAVHILFDEDDIGAHNVERISEQMRRHATKGFYNKVLREHAGVETCQVHNIEHFFRLSEQPDLLLQDIAVAEFCQPHLPSWRQRHGRVPDDLNDWYALRDELFQRYAPYAAAVKCVHAYWRPLRHEAVPRSAAEPLFARWRKGETLPAEEGRTLETHLFRACVEAATDHNLPVKLHTGYCGGSDTMPYEWVAQHAVAVSHLLRDFPRTKFVFLHVGYPHQSEFIALAKHFTNAYLDLAWTWILNPIASVRFAKECLLAVPANKLFTFGGDYVQAELVVGHAFVARKGLTQALSELVEEEWLGERDALDLVDPLMRGNARCLFQIPEKIERGRKQKAKAA